jgi:hypothetical protein
MAMVVEAVVRVGAAVDAGLLLPPSSLPLSLEWRPPFPFFFFGARLSLHTLIL